MENIEARPLPELDGEPIDIQYEVGLVDSSGHAAHAATSIRRRTIVLDKELEDAGPQQARVMVHELFHFVWVRLGNPKRKAWEDLLRTEWNGKAKGETGWSSEWRKREMKPEDLEKRSPYWREYCCEAFCDTAALIFCGPDEENNLGVRWQRGRRKWFAGNIEDRKLAL